MYRHTHTHTTAQHCQPCRGKQTLVNFVGKLHQAFCIFPEEGGLPRPESYKHPRQSCFHTRRDKPAQHSKNPIHSGGVPFNATEQNPSFYLTKSLGGGTQNTDTKTGNAFPLPASSMYFIILFCVFFFCFLF